MKKRVKGRERMQREGLPGEIVELFHLRNTGMIHGRDDGYDVTFNQESLVVGLSYCELDLGLKVTYAIFLATGAKVPTAINVMPALGQTGKAAGRENVRSARVGEFGAA
jgi:hypothetical protein